MLGSERSAGSRVNVRDHRLLGDRQEGVHDLGSELRPTTVAKLSERSCERQRASVRADIRHRVPSVRHTDDGRLERNVLAG